MKRILNDDENFIIQYDNTQTCVNNDDKCTENSSKLVGLQYWQKHEDILDELEPSPLSSPVPSPPMSPRSFSMDDPWPIDDFISTSEDLFGKPDQPLQKTNTTRRSNSLRKTKERHRVWNRRRESPYFREEPESEKEKKKKVDVKKIVRTRRRYEIPQEYEFNASKILEPTPLPSYPTYLSPVSPKDGSEKDKQEYQDLLLALQLQSESSSSTPFFTHYGPFRIQEHPHYHHSWSGRDRLGDMPSRGGSRGRGRGRNNLLHLQYIQRDFNGDDYELLLSLDDNKLNTRGATKTQVKTIKSQIKSDDIRLKCDQCSICLDDIQNNQDYKELKCQHSFHSKCIDTWLLQACTCPICLVQVTFDGITNEKKDKY